MTRCICSGILFVDIANSPVERFPAAGELIETEKIQLFVGGHAANVSLNLYKLGVPVAISGCVGDDPLSDFVLKSVSLDGIDTSRLKRVRCDCPGTSLLICVKEQDRRFISTTGANDFYDFDDSLLELLRAPANGENAGTSPAANNVRRVFYIGGYLMLKSLENERTPFVLETARQNGWTVILDVVLYGKRPYWDALADILPHVDIFTPNKDEAEILTGKNDINEQAKCFLEKGVGAVIITNGEHGTHYFSRNLSFHVPSYKMPFVSGAGSGDAFCAGYIAAFLEGCEPQECVRWGSAQGASCVRAISTTDAVFSKNELMSFLQES